METRSPQSSTEEDIEQLLFAKREKIYPREVHGIFAALRVSAVIGLLGLYYALPWLDWGDRQSVLFDLPARKFYVFGLTFWPQDFVYLTFLLILAALSLFFFTALAGRLWCGYACPQTVWTETFLWIERMVEGGRREQMKLDKTPMNLRKLRIKTTKHFIWVVFSLYTGFTFVAYFTPAQELVQNIALLELGPWESFWLFFYGFATYGNAGWMREQVCTYMCPYARCQSAMFDDDTLIVSYDPNRGEPRGPRKPGIDHRRENLGDCVNCTLCVQVCPTGIDIRDGLQYQCIGCSACIDACNDVMKKMHYPSGLIRYTTQNSLYGKKSRILRPRILVYAAILLCLLSIFCVSIFTRVPLALDVIRDRNQLYRETRGLIENVYTLKIINMDKTSHEYALTVHGLEGLQLESESPTIEVKAGEVMDYPVRVLVDEEQLTRRSTDILFKLSSMDKPGLNVEEHARLLGPL